MFFLGALYLQQVLGYDALHVGLAFLPATLAMGVTALRFSEPLTTRFGPLAALLPGLVSITVALLLFAQTPVDAAYAADVLPAMTLLGLGAGLAFPALTTVAMSGANSGDSGLASGLVNTSLNVGGAIGLAVLATLSSNHTHSLLAGGESTAAALNGGYHVAYLVAAALVAAAIALAVTLLRPRCSVAEPPGAAIEPRAATACPEAA
jgi:sugar phosphate permease